MTDKIDIGIAVLDCDDLEAVSGGTGVYARSMSAGANDLPVNNTAMNDLPVKNTVMKRPNAIMAVCPLCNNEAEQLPFSGGRMKCTLCYGIYM